MPQPSTVADLVRACLAAFLARDRATLDTILSDCVNSGFAWVGVFVRPGELSGSKRPVVNLHLINQPVERV